MEESARGAQACPSAFKANRDDEATRSLKTQLIKDTAVQTLGEPTDPYHNKAEQLEQYRVALKTLMGNYKHVDDEWF